MRFLLLLLLPAWLSPAQTVPLAGLKQPVEILRDRWGVPHIYARNTHDLFFAQGYMAARDRLFQIDLWRRAGTGKLAEVMGASAIPRDRIARLVRYRGDWDEEWKSYGPETRAIATAFTHGINAYIRSLNGKRPAEFAIAGYDPGLWEPEDCVARIAGLLMTRNLSREVARIADVKQFGLETVQKYLPPDPFVEMKLPDGLDPNDVHPDILRGYSEAVGVVRFPGEQGSNNWVVDGTMTATGKPLLANDPHRPILIPSLRKTVHLVAPGWNAYGAGEPSLPGIALGHNERIAFGFTIVGIDQQDLYVEKLNPKNPDEYWHGGAWRKMEIERQSIDVKGSKPQAIELRYTVHGPVIHEDRGRRRAYALQWVGSRPGTAGYLAGIALARANNWAEFMQAIERYKVPSENLVYADVDGNIGWQAGGMTPIRRNHSGLFPVPGYSGEYEWSGFLPSAKLPRLYNPPSHFIATANHNVLPPGYEHVLGYEWAPGFRFERVREMLLGRRNLTVKDFEIMQQDVVSVPARRLQAVIRKWQPPAGSRQSEIAGYLLRWDARMPADSVPAAIFEVWMQHLPAAVFGPELGKRTDWVMLLKALEERPQPKALEESLAKALAELEARLGPNTAEWRWGRLHRLHLRHPLNREAFNRGPIERPGDGQTVNAASGSNYMQANGGSYRQVIDLSDWDRSTMTNTPGESGDPNSPHYSDLLEPWAAGRYHPMLYTRKAVERAAVERIELRPN